MLYPLPFVPYCQLWAFERGFYLLSLGLLHYISLVFLKAWRGSDHHMCAPPAHPIRVRHSAAVAHGPIYFFFLGKIFLNFLSVVICSHAEFSPSITPVATPKLATSHNHLAPFSSPIFQVYHSLLQSARSLYKYRALIQLKHIYS